MRVREVKELNFLVGTMWFTAGAMNVLCAIFELLIGNTFAWTIFGALGGYFLSMGALLTPGFGVMAAYAKKGPHGIEEFENAMGLFNCCWAAMFILFFIVAIRTNIFMVLIFLCVSVTCILSALEDFAIAGGNHESAETLRKVCIVLGERLIPHANSWLLQVAGVFLLISSIPNWYLLFLILAASAGWPLRLPTGDLGAHKHAHAPPPAKHVSLVCSVLMMNEF